METVNKIELIKGWCMLSKIAQADMEDRMERNLSSNSYS
jgi:hypothetical protein